MKNQDSTKTQTQKIELLKNEIKKLKRLILWIGILSGLISILLFIGIYICSNFLSIGSSLLTIIVGVVLFFITIWVEKKGQLQKNLTEYENKDKEFETIKYSTTTF